PPPDLRSFPTRRSSDLGLLHGADYLSGAAGLPHRLVEQVADDLVTVGRNANPLALFDQVEDQLGADRRLSRTRRTLNRQVGLIRSEEHTSELQSRGHLV